MDAAAASVQVPDKLWRGSVLSYCVPAAVWVAASGAAAAVTTLAEREAVAVGEEGSSTVRESSLVPYESATSLAMLTGTGTGPALPRLVPVKVDEDCWGCTALPTREP